MGTIGVVSCLLTVAASAGPSVRPDRPNSLSFPPETARFVRFVIYASSSGEPCIDELEVYGPSAEPNLARASAGARPSASSCLAGNPRHAVSHLNDGRYGNDYSWIAAGTDREWAQVELARAAVVSKVVFSRDRHRQHADRVPIHFEIWLSNDGRRWKTVRRVQTTAAPVRTRGAFSARIPAAPPPPRMVGSGPVFPRHALSGVTVPEADGLGFANLSLRSKARPSASSLLPGHAIHQIAHLNDGVAGNSHSWISERDPSWAEIDLGRVYWIYRVAFGSDSSGRYNDRAPTAFSILVATEYDTDSRASPWKAVFKRSSGAPIHTRTPFAFEPVQARWVRIAVRATNGGQARIDEIEIYGQEDPLPPERVASIVETEATEPALDGDESLRYALLGEEHAWLKTYGRADLSARLVPYNGRVREYPRHVGDDVLPLPPLTDAPELDGSLDDACWKRASRAVARVAWPYEFDRSPLVSHAVTAGHKDGRLYLAIRTEKLLSGHIAVVSASDGAGAGALALTGDGLTFHTYADGKRQRSLSVHGGFDKSLTRFEALLPLSLFPGCRKQGLRIGLGMGGRHTPPHGRSIHFVFSRLSIAEVPPCVNRSFRVRLGVTGGGESLEVRGHAPGLAAGLTLAPGESTILRIPARGPIGPQFRLDIDEASGESYVLNLFRYDPLERTLSLTEEMVERFAARGLGVREERQELARLRKRHETLLARETPDLKAERRAFLDARRVKRRLFFRDPALEPSERILFVKRHAFEPSHNYSVLLDSRWRPGGGVYVLEIPRRDGRLEPGDAELCEVFKAGEGIARNPMADFDLSRIYFGYRPSHEGYYHIVSVNPDGSGLRQLTDGPFHDYWPCPLPDGSLAFISTRCKGRYLCWRPQAAVMFRMEADGRNIRPLSSANLTEWAPSVMSDGRLIWTRSEYIDKGADFSHTLWSIRPDGTHPELVFGNTIIQPNGYANGREVPGTREICCTLISHFGDLNGPIALVDLELGRFNPQAIRSITPEVPWPGMWPIEECFRDPVPVAKDYFLCSHAPRDRFALYVIDRFGNREILFMDAKYGSMCPTLFRAVEPPAALADSAASEGAEEGCGQFVIADVYRGLEPAIPRGAVRYIRVAQELRADLLQLPSGEYQKDHTPFMHWYATPVDEVSGPYGWPSYVAKATWGLAPVELDGSANFLAPAGKTLYFQALDEDFNELQRMRSVVQLQEGETRSCIGCHEDRSLAPPSRRPIAVNRPPSLLEAPPWGAGPVSYEKVVQPVWDAKCVRCHDESDERKIDLTGTLDRDRIPSSYRTLISGGWIHVLDCGYNSGGNEKREPMTFGTLRSKLWKVLDAGHYDTELTTEEMRRIKCWIDMNAPLWPDYLLREKRPGPRLAKTD